MASDEEDVLAANAAFYRAFAAGDPSAMDQLWARDTRVACVHPGWRALLGREEVMASWWSILGSPAAPAIAFHDATVHVNGDAAFVLCTERLPGGELAATNVFARERGGWRMVHHHAGPIAGHEPEDDDEPSGLLN